MKSNSKYPILLFVVSVEQSDYCFLLPLHLIYQTLVGIVWLHEIHFFFLFQYSSCSCFIWCLSLEKESIQFSSFTCRYFFVLWLNNNQRFILRFILMEAHGFGLGWSKLKILAVVSLGIAIKYWSSSLVNQLINLFSFNSICLTSFLISPILRFLFTIQVLYLYYHWHHTFATIFIFLFLHVGGGKIFFPMMFQSKLYQHNILRWIH